MIDEGIQSMHESWVGQTLRRDLSAATAPPNAYSERWKQMLPEDKILRLAEGPDYEFVHDPVLERSVRRFVNVAMSSHLSLSQFPVLAQY